MFWYATHAIMYVRFKKGRQKRYPIWENVLLLRAKDADDAWTKGTARARQDEGDSDGSMRWDGRAAAFVFAGLRRVVSVALLGSGERLRSGNEATYLEYDVADEKALRALVAGRGCDLRYASVLPPKERPPLTPTPASPPGRPVSPPTRRRTPSTRA